jgi:hypothetical protein
MDTTAISCQKINQITVKNIGLTIQANEFKGLSCILKCEIEEETFT